MTRFTQVLIFIIVAAALVFGITVLLQWRGTTTRSTGSGAADQAAPVLLEFEDSTYPPKVDGKESPLPEFGWNDTASHAFWFRNVSGGDNGTKEVEVGITYMQKCTCRSLAIALAPEDWPKTIGSEKNTWKNLPHDKQEEFLSAADWHELDKEDVKTDTPNRTFKVPPGRAGWVRVLWRGVTPDLVQQWDKKTFSATLWTGSGSTVGKPIDLLTGCAFVNRIHVQTEQSMATRKFETRLQLGRDLTPDSQPVASFLCWSTLGRFDCENELRPIEDPNVIWEKPEILSDARLKEISQIWGRDAKYGCLVRFKLKGLDLGQFSREFVLARDVSVPLTVWVEGYVVGPVHLRSGDARKPTNVIELGQFKASRGTTETIYAEVDRRGTMLELDTSRLPKFMDVSLTPPAGDNQWRLTVRITADKALKMPLGKFGDQHDTMIDLLVKEPGKEPQRMRIPVYGTVGN